MFRDSNHTKEQLLGSQLIESSLKPDNGSFS